ncbi:N-acetylglucosamine-6-phosphate deacetylase [Gordoniibacillus kamchatkensis]|uniref:N-acetylglucosamine-6-phosphate deacetylase n=1 Tax=Gordoniibacillus kamchatkensis TaxID=1590651 RepID=A0ABR5AH84_9BACL|nr:amidohydrolase family protein [Paenibacillus sp. VKM B-2647]KIL40384.1 N-acetylglucosamine-6-phosphate deacetylase [Paenibacillus sp. VKM B-2647]
MENESPDLQLQGLHYLTGAPVRIAIRQGRIAGVEPLNDPPASLRQLPWIGPGFVDLQINGYAGMDFNTLPIAPHTTSRLSRALWSEGVTSFFPTVITNSEDAILEAVSAIARECEEDEAAGSAVAGIHLEGPFISPEDGARGAHSRAYVRAPDWPLFQRWQEAARGRIKIVTVSPEWPEAEAFIRRCADSGVLVSIGHTAAAPDQIARAVAAGAAMSTHFGNGAHPVLPRHPNYLWEQLAADELWTCLIADGFHLPDSVLKVAMKVKGDKALLVSDAVMFSGMPAGTYESHIGGKVVLTPQGRLQMADQPQLLAGSVKMLPAGVSHLVKRGLCSLGEAWEMASVRPAKRVGLPFSAGLEAGAPADVLLIEWGDAGGDGSEPRIAGVYKNGVSVWP